MTSICSHSPQKHSLYLFMFPSSHTSPDIACSLSPKCITQNHSLPGVLTKLPLSIMRIIYVQARSHLNYSTFISVTVSI